MEIIYSGSTPERPFLTRSVRIHLHSPLTYLLLVWFRRSVAIQGALPQSLEVAELDLMTDELLDWIRGLIRDDNVHAFYNSRIWRRLAAKVLEDNHHECARCKAKGLVVKARTVHHKEYLRKHPELALNTDNLEPICDDCHYDEHHRGSGKQKHGFVNEERW